ncbi:uncharacterized protein LOC118279397 [Spodoptera frugiperda]|uniref:Uncharacterized protein LOC118279397 n=1 Tax=Spodoptera frugiperda TaxID=7108 RepID=A0A9R0DIW4_SPOFR|nr:uncharacterized protein LOC118279397 [Spodoptera frugiperda]
MWRECGVLMLVCVFGAGSLSGRGFFCRDPETGKLHGVNTTWPSTSFCGNYHCKLKRKNMTGTNYAPLRLLNVTTVSLENQNISVIELKKNVSENETSTKESVKLNKKPHSNIINGILSLQANKENKVEDTHDDKNVSDKDRYLSEKEIRSLTEMLHTVKKSDLDAIVEIYNLAQDIYKEIDKTSTEKTQEETKSDMKNVEKEKNELENPVKPTKDVSYWYEPLASNKMRAAEPVHPGAPRIGTIRHDIFPGIPPALPVTAQIMPAVADAAPQTVQNPIQTTPTSTTLIGTLTRKNVRTNMESFFENGPLSSKDFGKLPYYYHLSHFQRSSSYKHDRNKPKPVSKKTHHLPQPTHKTITYKPLFSGGKYQKEIKPSILLPYPFSNIIHYNWSVPQIPRKNVYHRSHVYDQVESLNTNPTLNTNPVKQLVNSNAILMNPDLENFQDLQMKPSMLVKKSVDFTKKDEVRMPDWQSDPLPQQILEEVRAHIQEKQKMFLHPFPLRKKAKLERVVMNLDEIKRTKRWATQNEPVEQKSDLEPELYEVYIERTTCNSDYSVPGFFRYGNLSQPYPECCPQRIPT